MSAQENKGRGCLKISCMGCLLLIGLSVLGTAASFFIITSGPSVERDRDFELAEVEWSDAEILQGDEIVLPPIVVSPDHPDASGSLLDPGAMPTGRVELELKFGQFYVEPAEPGAPPSVEARFDEENFRLEERLQTRPDGSWVYRVSFDKRKSIFSTNEADNRVTVRLPRDRFFELVGDLGMGESRLDLGGLAMTRIGLEAGMGSHSVHFSDPLTRPLESLTLKSSMGEVLLNRVGNASPARLDVGHRMGKLELDLRGQWQNDSRISGRLTMGELRYRAPDYVNIDASGVRATMGERFVDPEIRGRDADPALPTLKLEGSVFMGSIDVR